MVLIQLWPTLHENDTKQPRVTFVDSNNLFFRYLRVHGFVHVASDKDSKHFSTKIISLLLIIGLCANVYFFAQQKDYNINIGGVSWFADIGVWFGPCWVTLVAYIEITSKSTTQQRLILLINQLDTVLRDDLKCFVPYAALRKYKYVKYGGVQLIIGTTMMVISRNIFTNHFRQFYCQMLIMCHLVQAISMMFLFYFDSIHDRLSVCLDKIRSLLEEDPVVWFTRGRAISERFLNKISVKQLFLIKDVLRMTEESFQLLNTCFGWTLVFLMVMFGIEIICNAYWIFLDVSRVAKDASIWDNICLITFSITLLLVLTHSVANCSSKVDDIVSMLQKCNNHRDKSLNYVLSEIIIEKSTSPMSLTARGFFTIKPQMIRYTLSAIFTYLIILIQFKQKEGITPDGY